MADTTTHAGSGHPIGAVVGAARAGFAGIVEAQTWSLGGAETRDLLVEVTALAAQVAELQARLLVHGESTGATSTEVQATSTAAWLAGTTRTVKRDAFAATKLAGKLAAWEATRFSVARGEVLPDQAGVIVDAVEALPEQTWVRQQCEKHLLALAAEHDAKDLKTLGRRVLAVIDPEAAEAHEAKLLEEEEKRAATKTRFSMGTNGDGTHTGRFTIPDLYADMLKKALHGFAAPKHVRSQGGAYDYQRPSPERAGEAFCEFIERHPIDQVPDAGGTSATVVVTVELATLLGGIKAAALDTGTMITAGTARRLACEAGIIPAVLNGTSQVLDLGRKNRFHTKTQRLAIGLAQKHCQAPACTDLDRPGQKFQAVMAAPSSDGSTPSRRSRSDTSSETVSRNRTVLSPTRRSSK
ncbi:DUF222 domain-containing protein [Nocardioides sp.]|uniref:DUF222 domain-containing protein n=1 Tax=Nocardioides sp. TaxID=35761 RepID=UPI002B26E342|nr:DUF222 domain-containing protein [Nocardioides sp.]